MNSILFELSKIIVRNNARAAASPKSKLINNRKIDKRKFVTQEKNNKLYKEFV